MNKAGKLPVLIVLLGLPFLAAAELYKWTDENGVITFSDQKPDQQTVERIVVSTSQRQLAEVEGDALSEADCAAGIKRGHAAIAGQLVAAERQRRNGALAAPEYGKILEEGAKLRLSLSISTCRSAQGKQAVMFRCLAGDQADAGLCFAARNKTQF